MYKALALTATLLFASPLVAFAAPGDSPPHMDMISERLQLTDEQKTQVQPILEQHREDRRAILTNAGIERGTPPTQEQLDAIRMPLQEARDRRDQALAAVLSPEQMTTFNEMQQQMRDRMQNKMGSGSGATDSDASDSMDTDSSTTN
ncbi:hypothetical protein GCM10007094_35620 [Pseudovibrio japonicus]|uniref:LTXXQ motif family protein n=1 Tax=Pseudovibrio japonicus TaxID=366534 RepID=A0ABQ3ENF0_9HYPH|nr:LTXXQ motif family protein [Pseudovibrio japonicus]GHB43094.1 hypothetical protein GCM10007094_35620 [Pseudovibrio japonicus]